MARARTDVSSIPAIDPEAAVRRPDGDGDRFGVVEQQRRKLAARPESVAARHPGSRLHGIAERAQLLHITADRARSYLEAIGKFVARPLAADLEQ